MQQVNLYQPLFRKQKTLFSTRTMSCSCLFFMLIFFGIYLFSAWRISPLMGEIDRLDRDRVQLAAQYDTLKRQTSGQASGLLVEKLASMEDKLRRTEQMQQLLGVYLDLDIVRFSSYLESLSRQHIDGIWLTRFAIIDGGGALDLEGRTIAPELLPMYLRYLSREAVLQGVHFNTMQLDRSEMDGDHLNFKVGTMASAP